MLLLFKHSFRNSLIFAIYNCYLITLYLFMMWYLLHEGSCSWSKHQWLFKIWWLLTINPYIIILKCIRECINGYLSSTFLHETFIIAATLLCSSWVNLVTDSNMLLTVNMVAMRRKESFGSYYRSLLLYTMISKGVDV